MSDAVPLPPHPDLDQYKKLARELQRASDQVAGEDAVHTWATHWLERRSRSSGEYLTGQEGVRLAQEAAAVKQRWLVFTRKRGAERCSLTDAQLFVAREHGFLSWPRFAAHLRALSNDQSSTANFEAAADAIVGGDEQRLLELLRSDMSLVKTRSTREHRSTLLHYCSANGVEDYRQKTPQNIITITKQLLDAGAEVNAESDAYGGRSTTLMLTATSVHPERAGVQIPLLELLLERGAAIDVLGAGNTVTACLRNGRRMAAEFLANKGAKLDQEGAAGVGRLDVIASFFAANGALRPPAKAEQLAAGLKWACEFGRSAVVEFLLEHGVRADVALDAEGETALHYAALGGESAIVNLLLVRGADVHAVETRFHGTPLGWALHGWSHRAPLDDGMRYYEVVGALVKAGASGASSEGEIGNPQMLAALRGEYRSTPSST